ncbi:MAG TPA: hypothetical protein VD905_07295 [Flavobacteriales bacterium]|nr:hypothetical protein [Flavobacteriales bacterium]
MADLNINLVNAFDGVLDNLIDGDTYKNLPPKGPIDLPSASDEELNALDQDKYGQDEREDFPDDDEFKIKLVETAAIKKVNLPNEDQLDGLSVIGISGDNQRILTTSFHLILSRTSLVNFKYTKGYDKPYFYNRYRNSAAITLLDNNIFDAPFRLHCDTSLVESNDSVPILDSILKSTGKPFLFRYNHERSKKAPNSHSLGLAVKFQHTLELAALNDTEFAHNGITICLKDGAMFSNSTQLSDIRNGLRKLLSWSDKKQIYVAVSTQVSDSRVLINTLCNREDLIQEYFPDQGITTGIIKSFGTDTLLLKKILRPGYRTPLTEYIERTRLGALVNDDPNISTGVEGLKPVTCYYQRRSKPYNFIRLEIPKFMWEENKELTLFAISVAIWQHELGVTKPLVLQAAEERCNLKHDKRVIEQQLQAAFDKKNLELIEFINNG